MKLLKKHSLVIAFLSLALVAVITAGTTMAYYMASAGEKVNHFEFQEDIIAKLDEYNWDADEGIRMVPGKELRKDPVITNMCRMDEYVAVKITFQHADKSAALSQIDYDRLISLISVDWNVGAGESQWTLVSGEGTPEQVYVYNQLLSPGEVSEPTLHSVRIHTNEDADKPMTEVDLRWLQGIRYENGQAVPDENSLGGFNILVEGAAIQADSLSSPEGAYAGLLALFS